MHRAGDWLAQARRDLEASRACAREGLAEQACFLAQQAAEKALKAIYEARGEVAWGHSVQGLLANLPKEAQASPDLLESAERLDRHYVGARYPNGWQSGAPKDHYSGDDARAAIGDSESILAWCDRMVAGS